MATVAARSLKLPRLGYFDDFGLTATESTGQDALRAFSPERHPGLRARGAKVQWGARIEFLGATVTFLRVNDKWADRLTKLTDEIRRILGRREAFLAQVRKLVAELNLAETSATGEVGRVGRIELSGNWETGRSGKLWEKRVVSSTVDVMGKAGSGK